MVRRTSIMRASLTGLAFCAGAAAADSAPLLAESLAAGTNSFGFVVVHSHSFENPLLGGMAAKSCWGGFAPGVDPLPQLRGVPLIKSYKGESYYSVETGCCWWLSAAFIVCHAKVAHLTRIGNSLTPEKTASLPRASISGN